MYIQKEISTSRIGHRLANGQGTEPDPGRRAMPPTMASRRPPIAPKPVDEVEPGEGESVAKAHRPAPLQSPVPDPFVGLKWSPRQIAEGRRLLAAQADGLMRVHQATEASWQARLADLQASQATEQRVWAGKLAGLSEELASLRSGAESPGNNWHKVYPLRAILHDRFVETICDGIFPEPPFYWPLDLKWRHFFLNDEALRERLATKLKLTDERTFGDRVLRAYDLMEPTSTTPAGEGSDMKFRQTDLDLAEQLLLHFQVPGFMIRKGMYAFQDKVVYEEN